MNLRQIRYVCALAEAGSLGRAAERLHVAPTAISMQLAQLERTLGGELFNRAVRPMSLTPLGRHFLPRARELMQQAERLEQDTRDLAHGRRGRLTIGFVRSLIFSVVPRGVRAFREQHPEVKIELIEMLSENQPEALRSGRIDLGLSRLASASDAAPGLSHTPLFTDPYVAAVSSARVPAGRGAMSLAELDALPFIHWPNNADSGYARRVLALLRAAGGQPVIGHEPIEIQTALGLVAADLGYAIVGASVAEESRRDIAFVQVSELQLPELQAATEVVAVTRIEDASPLAGAMIGHLAR